MRRFVKRFVITLLVLASLAAIFLYRTIASLEIETVTDDVAMIRGAGGNVGVLRTERGAVVVDSMTFAERFGGPTQVLINTHYHSDHTHGNPGFAPGMQVVATQRTRDYLVFFDDDYWQGDRRETLPNDTFEDRKQLAFGDKTVQVVHAGRGHTGGDLVVLFVEDRVLHTGDLFLNGRYPNIDLEAGGSVEAWPETSWCSSSKTACFTPATSSSIDATRASTWKAAARCPNGSPPSTACSLSISTR